MFDLTTILQAVQVLLLAGVIFQLRRNFSRTAASIKHAENIARTVEPVGLSSSPGFCVVKRVDNTWLRWGDRPAGHPDLTEALATPGLAVLTPEGVLEEGVQ